MKNLLDFKRFAFVVASSVNNANETTVLIVEKVTQMEERTTPGEEVLVSIAAVAACSLLVGVSNM